MNVPDDWVRYIKAQNERLKKAIVAGVGDALAQLLRDQVEPLRKRIEALEQQIEQRKYVGTWQPGAAYRAGNEATHSGGRWHCVCDTTSKPGTDSTWKLCAKGDEEQKRKPTNHSSLRNNMP